LMKPQLGLREGYIYNNVMYAAAGYVMETVTGKSWEELIREKIFFPLEMKASVFDNIEMKKSSNYSLAYFEPDTSRNLFLKKFEAQSSALGPAGTIVSSAEDMSHWMIAQLNGGMYKGKQVISSQAINETMVPNIIAEKTARYDELSNALYGMGRTIQTYKGLKITSHTGSIDGFYSSLLFLPSKGIGIFMVHNGEAGGSLRSVMTLPVLDLLLGLTYTPWSQRYMQDYKKARAAARRAADSIKATRVNGTTPSHALADFAGSYESNLFGSLEIKKTADSLHLSFRKIETPLTHFHYDQFITKEEKTDTPKLRLNFLTNDKGEIDRVSIGFGEGQEIFIRKKGGN
jgi:CubicO group peptidase (beta-lactamase class C family)